MVVNSINISCSIYKKRKLLIIGITKVNHLNRDILKNLNRTIQEEFVDYNEEWLDNVDEFNVKLIQWINWYNTKRYHWGLNLMTPVDYLLTNGYRVQYVVN